MSRKERLDYARMILVVLAAMSVMCIGEDLWAAARGGRRMLTFWEYVQYPRIWLSFLFGIGGAVLLMAITIRRWLRVVTMAAGFIVFGVLPVFHEVDFFAKLAPHPSPLCALTRPVMFSLGEGRLIVPVVFAGVLLLIGVLSLMGTKLFCGWACPIGALQELAYILPLYPKKLKPRFAAVNTVRALLLIAFVPALAWAGIYLYGYFNPFEILHWPLGTDFWTGYAWAVIAVTILFSLFVFRPFCYTMCPIGILTWLLEQAALTRVIFNRDTCTRCSACTQKAPCLAVQAIIEEKHIRPDCYACGRCIEACPTQALTFGMRHIKG